MKFKKIELILVGMLLSSFWLTACSNSGSAVNTKAVAAEAAPAYYLVVIASDVHYPSKTSAKKKPELRQAKIHNKENALSDINKWKDVNLVVFTGDIVEKTGSAQNYAEAKKLCALLTKPKAFVTGNHEFMYQDTLTAKNKLVRGTPEQRQEKLQRFKDTFGLSSLYYTKTMGKYLLIFLSPDMPKARFLTEMSPEELAWLQKTLAAHKEQPTICFFHAPLAGTLDNYSKTVNTPNFIAQPEESLRQILLANPQIVLWVSGHTHTPPTNASFANDKVNCYLGTKILDVQNPTWDGDQVWTNSLYLYPGKIVIKTYDHKEQTFMEPLTRTVTLPKEN